MSKPLKILAVLTLSAATAFLTLIIYVWDRGLSFGIFGPPLPIPFWRRLPDPEGSYLKSRRQALVAAFSKALDTFSATEAFSAYDTSSAFVCYQGVPVKWGNRPFNHRCTFVLVRFYGFDGKDDLVTRLREAEPKLAAQGWTRATTTVIRPGSIIPEDPIRSIVNGDSYFGIVYKNADLAMQLTWKEHRIPFWSGLPSSARGETVYRREELENALATNKKILEEHTGVLVVRMYGDFYEN
jgi:hypothetical protein